MRIVDSFLKKDTKVILGVFDMIKQQDIDHLSIRIEFLKELEKKDLLVSYQNISLAAFKDIKIPEIRVAIDQISSDTPYISFYGEDISLGLSKNRVFIDIGRLFSRRDKNKKKMNIFLQEDKLQDAFSDINLILGVMISEIDMKLEKFDFSIDCSITAEIPSKSLEEIFIKEKALLELGKLLKSNVSGVEIIQIEGEKKTEIGLSEDREKNKMKILVSEKYSSKKISISFNSLIKGIIEKTNNIYLLLEGEQE